MPKIIALKAYIAGQDSSKDIMMTLRLNMHGQEIGQDLPNWQRCASPELISLKGHYTQLVPLNINIHLDDLFQAYQTDTTGKIWTYNYIGPFATIDDFRKWGEKAANQPSRPVYVIYDEVTAKPAGISSFLNIQDNHGTIEIGGITLAPHLQRSRAATEAMYLMMSYALDILGYRRLEWKCDSLNAPSRAAAERFGFTFEGIFHQAAIYKGRNRDTAWYAIIDTDWPLIKKGFESWLAPDNFDETGQQKQKLANIRTLLSRHNYDNARF